MDIKDFEREFSRLPSGYKTRDVDEFNKRFIREGIDVSFLRPLLPEHEEYYRTYFSVSIRQRRTKEEKLAFVEENADLLHDWWHVDGIVSFLGDSLDLDYAMEKAREYIKSPLPYVRRLGYVLFIPRLVRDREKIEPLFSLFKNDSEYHVIMAEAWLISFLAMCDAERTYRFLLKCELDYAIVGKAIRKICDSHVISSETKELFKGLGRIKKSK